MSHLSEGGEKRLRRRNVLRAVGATTLGGSLAGCLSQKIEKKATPVGMPPEKAKEAGYDPEPKVETITADRERSAGPASIKAKVTSYVVRYEYVGTNGTQAAYGGGDYGADDSAGLFTSAVTPKVGLLGQNFNEIAEADINELVEKRTNLFEKFCNCKIGNPGQINVRHVDDPTNTKVDGTADVYLLAHPGCQNPNRVCIQSIDTQGPTIPDFLGKNLTAGDLTALFVPDFENKKAYYAIGTKVFNETENGTDAVFSAYVGTVSGKEVGNKLEPRKVAFLVSSQEDEGLFTPKTVGNFNKRFSSGLDTLSPREKLVGTVY